MVKKKFISSVITLIVSAAFMVSAVYAWFAISDSTRMGGMIVSLSDYDAEVDFFVKRNSEDSFTKIEQSTQLKTFFEYFSVAETLYFKVSVANKATDGVYLSLTATGFTSTHKDANGAQVTGAEKYDLLDLFHADFLPFSDILEQEQAEAEGASTLPSVVVQKPLADAVRYAIAITSNTAVQKYGFQLHDYRLSNILNNANQWGILSGFYVDAQSSVDIYFGLTYHEKANGQPLEHEVNIYFTSLIVQLI